MAPLDVKLAAHHNIDSNVVKVQVFVVDQDGNFRPNDVVSGEVQLFNVFTTPQTGLVEVPLEKMSFAGGDANQDDYFSVFVINPAVSTNLEARASLDLLNQGNTAAVSLVLSEEGTFSDQPNTSIIGNATNPSWHLDKNKQRDVPQQDVSPHTPSELGDTQIVTTEAANAVLEDIQFEQLASVLSANQLGGQLVYLGGGNRLLPKPGSLSLQAIDVPPWELGTSTFVEQNSAQLLPNNTYTEDVAVPNGSGRFPLGYTMDSPGINIVESRLQKLQSEGFSARVWNIQVNGASPTSISPFTEASFGLGVPLAFDTLKPIALSILAGMEKTTPDTDITSAKLVLTFFDSTDVELSPSKEVVLNPDDLFNARPLVPFSIQAQPSEYPPTTAKFTWRLKIDAVSQGDFVTVLMALPSITATPFATSTVLSTFTRETDNLSFIPDTAFSTVEGAMLFELALGFSGSPTETKWIFDTRDPLTLVNGVALRVDATGTLTLLVQNATATGTLTTPSPVPWVSGKITEVLAEWSNTLLRISVDGAVLMEDTVAVVPDMSAVSATSIQLGADSDATGSLDSEFIRAVFLDRPRS